MENFVTEYGNALIALVCGGGLFTIGWNKYTRYVRWLNESKSTKAKVVNLEKVTVETESSVYEMDRPTFRYSTTGEILVSKARQLFPLGELKTGDSHTVRYNSRTPGRILSDQAKNLPLMYIYGVIFLGGALVVLSLLLFLI